MKNQIEQLKRSKNAVILAHYYAPAEVQEIADYVGDSFYLAKLVDIGVDYISSGALTHSSPILDLSLKNLHAI